MTRRTLVERAQHGDREAFEALAAEIVDRLYSAAVLIVHDQTIAEDAVQEALLRAWRGIPRLRDPDKVESWLHRILLNSCLDTAKHARGNASPLEASGWRDGDGGFETDVGQRDLVSRGLARLTPQQRGVLVMRYFVGLSVPELADALGVPLGTAKSRLHNALGAMRAAVDADSRVVVQGGLA